MAELRPFIAVDGGQPYRLQASGEATCPITELGGRPMTIVPALADRRRRRRGETESGFRNVAPEHPRRAAPPRMRA